MSFSHFSHASAPETDSASVFGPSYWKSALKRLYSPLFLAFAALMVAASVVLHFALIQLTPALRMEFTYLSGGLCGMVCGPFLALLYGVASDLVGLAVYPTGSYYFGYTVSAMAGALVYALFFFRHRITFVRILLCRLTINLLINSLLGTVWRVQYYSGGDYSKYGAYFWTALPKNLILLPIEAVLMGLLFNALMPALVRMKFVGIQSRVEIRRRALISACILAVLVLAALIVHTVNPSFFPSVFEKAFNALKRIFS